MSDLLLVVPPGWTQLDWSYITNNVPGMTRELVDDLIMTQQFDYFSEPFRTAGLIPMNKAVLEAKLIDSAYFLVVLRDA